MRPAPTVSVKPALSTFSGVLLWAPPSGIPHFRPNSCRGKLPVIFCLLLLILSVDIELNAGPAVNHPSSNVRFSYIDICSAVNKAVSIHDTIADFRLDFLALSEARITPDMSNAVRNDIAPPTYTVLHAHRSPTANHPHGGGLAIIHKNMMIVKPHQFDPGFNPETFNVQVVHVVSLRPPIMIVNVYRPPSTSVADFVTTSWPASSHQ